jgi:hypothetical protein
MRLRRVRGYSRGRGTAQREGKMSLNKFLSCHILIVDTSTVITIVCRRLQWSDRRNTQRTVSDTGGSDTSDSLLLLLPGFCQR